MDATKRIISSADYKLKTAEQEYGFGSWTYDPEKVHLEWSPGMFRVCGLDPLTVVPALDTFQSLVHPEDQKQFLDAAGFTVEYQAVEKTFRIICPDGKLKWIKWITKALFDRGGHILFVMGLIRDVTHEQILSNLLEDGQSVHRTLGKLLNGYVWTAFPDGKPIDIGPWMKFTGQTPKEVRDWDKLEAVHPDDRQAFRHAWEKAIASETEMVATFRLRATDGKYLPVISRALPHHTPAGELTHWVGYSIISDGRDALTENLESRIEAAHIRGARAMLGWSATDLAKHADLPFSCVRRMEVSTRNVKCADIAKAKAALDRNGVIFAEDPFGKIRIGFR